MKAKTSAMPMAPASMVWCRKSRPSVAEMLLKPTSRISSGSEPNFSTVTSDWASLAAKPPVPPEIWARPPKRVARMAGADMTSPSSTMANCSP